MIKSKQGGFTLIEVLISSVILIPILVAVLSTRDIVGRTINTNERRADAGDHLRRVVGRLRRIMRPALASTVKTRAMQVDIDAAIALEVIRVLTDPLGTPIYIPFMGEWISPIQNDPRANVQFQCADGELSMNAAALTTPRSLQFRMDANEVDNGVDDDGDGLVDEGKLFLTYESLSFVLVDNIESCTFSTNAGTITATLQIALRDQAARLHRATVQQRLFLRNN